MCTIKMYLCSPSTLLFHTYINMSSPLSPTPGDHHHAFQVPPARDIPHYLSVCDGCVGFGMGPGRSGSPPSL